MNISNAYTWSKWSVRTWSLSMSSRAEIDFEPGMDIKDYNVDHYLFQPYWKTHVYNYALLTCFSNHYPNKLFVRWTTQIWHKLLSYLFINSQLICSFFYYAWRKIVSHFDQVIRGILWNNFKVPFLKQNYHVLIVLNTFSTTSSMHYKNVPCTMN